MQALLFESFAGLLAMHIHLATLGRVKRELIAGSSAVDRFGNVDFACIEMLAIVHGDVQDPSADHCLANCYHHRATKQARSHSRPANEARQR